MVSGKMYLSITVQLYILNESECIFSMARKNENKQTTQNNEHIAQAIITGIVAGYYDKGKKYDYVTIDVYHSYDEYYDRFKVAVSKNWECPDDGEVVTLQCNIKAYKGEVSFKEVNADTQ